MPMTGNPRRDARRWWLASLTLAVTLATSGCSRSGDPGRLVVNSMFTGRIPAGGHLTLGAVDSRGRTTVAGEIGPHARKTLFLPAASYTVAVWLPQAPRPATYRALCTAHATVSAGRTSTVWLSCLWH